MHHLILPTDKGYYPKHINEDTLDNRRNNLIPCNYQQAKWSRKGVANHSSKYKGVSFQKASKKWVANIQTENRAKYLGLFLTEEEAAVAYNKAAKKLFGKFARLNII